MTQPSSLSPESQRWLERADVAQRKSLGQYMTPRLLRETLLDHMDLFPGMRVLDPGVGTGEFLRGVLDREPDAEVLGWDVDPAILDVARTLVPEAKLGQRDALDPYQGEPFDLVIGNPPYFQIYGASKELRAYYASVISGRVNIFALFFQVGLEALKPGGQLGYVVPPSMNNGAYFEGLREYLKRNAGIEYLEVFNDARMFADAQTAVQLIGLRLGAQSQEHLFTRRSVDGLFERTILVEKPADLEREFVGRRTLFDLGFEAVTGTIVWNQHKASLRSEQSQGVTPLLWAQNIGPDGSLLLRENDPKRPQYVITPKRTLTGPAVVVNRIVGSVGKASLRCALVPEGMEFVGENHVNVIRPLAHTKQQVSWEALLAALRHEDVAPRVLKLTGNTQVSATELTHLLPLDV